MHRQYVHQGHVLFTLQTEYVYFGFLYFHPLKVVQGTHTAHRHQINLHEWCFEIITLDNIIKTVNLIGVVALIYCFVDNHMTFQRDIE